MCDWWWCLSAKLIHEVMEELRSDLNIRFMAWWMIVNEKIKGWRIDAVNEAQEAWPCLDLANVLDHSNSSWCATLERVLLNSANESLQKALLERAARAASSLNLFFLIVSIAWSCLMCHPLLVIIMYYL